jgi:uncharacterized protein with PQ loop repeat
MKESIGWFATLAFASSYLLKNENHLRYMQAFASVIWIIYGGIIGAKPVIVANVIVAALAMVSALRSRNEES